MEKRAIVNTVMLIDDNHTDNYIHSRILEHFNFAEKIIIYNSSPDALEYLHTYQGNTDKLPNLIFLDLILPGLDGFDFLKKFNTFPEHVKEKSKIVILSSWENYDRSECAGRESIIDYFPKPLSMEALKKIEDNLVELE